MRVSFEEELEALVRWKEAVIHTRELLSKLPTEEIEDSLVTHDVEPNLEKLMRNELKQRRKRERRQHDYSKAQAGSTSKA